MSSYKYAKLEQDRQTRLADILPGKLEDQVRVAFRVAAIPAMNNQGNSQTASNIPVEDHPHYEALSYAWGPLSDTVDVLVVNGHVSTIPVTRNLEEGLRHLRYEDRPRTMWIDALCINQVNLRERSWHVAKMCNIYAAAYRVVVWLGLEADDSAYALNELAKLGKQLDVAYNTEKITILSPVDGEPPPRDETTLELRFGKRELEAVAALIDRNWFGRLWIRQEIYVASSASVICGRTEVPWDAVARGLFCVWQWPKRDVLEVKVLSRLAARLDLVRLLVDRSRHMSYKYLRRELAGVHWTDPRDAVYAVQGMLRSEDRAVGVVPDYSLPPARVYTDVAVRVMQAQESLDVTSSCDMAQHYMEGLPSWVPDWWRHTNMKMEVSNSQDALKSPLFLSLFQRLDFRSVSARLAII
jgi:hypothetical protein